MARGSAKVDARGIIRAHRRTYRDATSGNRRWQDHLLIEGVPLGVFLGCLVGEVTLSSPLSLALLTVSGLLSALLFGVMLQVSDRAMSWSEAEPSPGPDTSTRAIYLEELAANAGYSSLVCIAAAIAYVVSGVGSGWVLRISSAVGLALGVHLVLVLLMVMKRVFHLTVGELNRARTGARERLGRDNRR